MNCFHIRDFAIDVDCLHEWVCTIHSFEAIPCYFILFALNIHLFTHINSQYNRFCSTFLSNANFDMLCILVHSFLNHFVSFLSRFEFGVWYFDFVSNNIINLTVKMKWLLELEHVYPLKFHSNIEIQSIIQ